MPKFGKIYECLIRDGVATLDQFHCPQVAPRNWIELAHSPDYVISYLTGALDPKAMRRIGFPWSPALTTRTCAAVGGTVLAAELALVHGMACNTAGGTHHAHPSFGSGFCIFNDLAIAAAYVVTNGLAQRVLIVDLDVHQGDGTAHIFQDDPRVFTFSMHCDKNFPFRKQQSDLDVPLPVGTEDQTYLRALAAHLPDLLTQVKPDLVLYDAGVDPHKDDNLGKLALTDAGIYRRDKFVLQQCLQRGIPVAIVVGGGYAKDHERLARRHTLVHRAASELYPTL
jgi:acetoin utilization deacetylase AcuC-like enzyme